MKKCSSENLILFEPPRVKIVFASGITNRLRRRVMKVIIMSHSKQQIGNKGSNLQLDPVEINICFVSKCEKIFLHFYCKIMAIYYPFPAHSRLKLILEMATIHWFAIYYILFLHLIKFLLLWYIFLC